ncbi:scavenger receptor cysteine-rich type 1 protein M130-like [Strongylocentrotus purpuratus]|uniref:SRCR domain-containing protein n=1 Tax=Strongylocentrotus purpuratus TaxID=7668 RepID=A0A7M7N5H2_STRPU|nr:scavenger receptor cysteine-rich type 1 protein M130-like [Strongylocentrotus purpuratus]
MEIRLMYGMNSAEGAVVMYKDNRWWPICGESWTHTEAKIVCKQLGFPYPYAESHSLPAYIDMNVSRGMNWLDGFQCGGHESQLKWCRYAGWGYCTSRLAAGVTCHRPTVSESSIFESNYLWPLAMVMFGGFTIFVCYKKAREQHNMQTTTLHQHTLSLEESDDENPPETGNQVYPDSVIHHHNAAFNGGNLKTTYTTRPLSRTYKGTYPWPMCKGNLLT